jgi:hypothetical protein
VQLHRLLHLLPGQKNISPARISRSSFIVSMAGVTRAQLYLVCMGDGCKHFPATLAVNSLVLRAMPALQQLTLALPTGMAGDLDRLGQRTLSALLCSTQGSPGVFLSTWQPGLRCCAPRSAPSCVASVPRQKVALAIQY